MYVSFTKSARATNGFPFSNFAFELRERLKEFFIISGTILQILGPLKDNVSVPFKTVWTFSGWNGFLFLKLYWSSLIGKMDFTKDGEISLYVFVHFCSKFLQISMVDTKRIVLTQKCIKRQIMVIVYYAETPLM